MYFIVLLYFQKYKTRTLNPETMYFCFRVLYFQKYRKTITFSITFSMLGAPGVYFLYFLRYLGCAGRMKFGLRCSYAGTLFLHVLVLLQPTIGTTPKTFASCLLVLECLPYLHSRCFRWRRRAINCHFGL